MNTSDTPGTPPGPRRVLVVEDNSDSRATLQLLLSVLGHVVEVVGDGLRGVQMALAWRPDVAIIGIGLPVFDGYEAARTCRAALANNILLVALTDYGRPEDRERAGAAGFDTYLVRPADSAKLTRLLGGPAGPPAAGKIYPPVKGDGYYVGPGSHPCQRRHSCS